jgi:hypothetical protein
MQDRSIPVHASNSLCFAVRAVRSALIALAIAACGFPHPPDVAECTSSPDCHSVDAPFCIAGSCVAACGSNDDCAGVAATPLCQLDTGACVACIDDASCPTDKPVCDATARACRACDRDDECASGVCLEAEGRCAQDSEIVYLRELNASDNPMCTLAAPCQTFSGAVAATTPQRYVIHLIGGTFHMALGQSLSGKKLYIDGSDTTITCDQGECFTATTSGPTITIGRVTIKATAGTAIRTASNGLINLYRVTLGSTANTNGGSIDARSSTLLDLVCGAPSGGSGGTLRISESNVRSIDATACTLTLRRNHFAIDVVSPLISSDGGNLIIENNTFVSTEAFTDPLTIFHAVAGSRFAFNTVANLSGVDATATAMFCDASLDVSSNIFAWHSSASKATSGCTAHDTVFDEFVPAAQIGANVQAPAASIFLDLNGKDLHLSATSPARGLGQAGVVDVDLEGHPRPSPAGSKPDAGAYEAQ